MTDAQLYSEWTFWLVVAGIIVLAAAALLIAVWLSARRIFRLARAALELVLEIKLNTQSIWELEKTNDTAVRILEEADAIREHAGTVAEALHQNR